MMEHTNTADEDAVLLVGEVVEVGVLYHLHQATRSGAGWRLQEQSKAPLHRLDVKEQFPWHCSLLSLTAARC